MMCYYLNVQFQGQRVNDSSMLTLYVKCHPKTGQEGPKKDWRYSCTFFNLGPRCRCMFNASPQRLWPQERDHMAIVQKSLWGPKHGPDRCGKSRSGIRSPKCPAPSKSLFRLLYPSHLLMLYQYQVQCLLMKSNLRSGHTSTVHQVCKSTAT